MQKNRLHSQVARKGGVGQLGVSVDRVPLTIPPFDVIFAGVKESRRGRALATIGGTRFAGWLNDGR